MKEITEKVIHLQLIKTSSEYKRIAYDENGEIANPKQSLKITYNSKQWHNFLINHKSLGLLKMDVVGAVEFDGNEWKKIDCTKEIIEEVAKAWKGKQEEEKLTPEQIKIKNLEEQIAKLMESKEERPERPKRGRKPKEEITEE